jgi:hypothetical protein
MGYVYLNGIFGGHAWTEILAGHDWIPIDAALTSEGVADAARFAFTWTSLENGVGSLASGGGQQLYGKLDVRVTAYAVAEGAEVSVPASRAPYRVTGNHYVNPGLGLSLTKPDRFAFEGLDAVWPSDTLLAMSGPSEARLLIVERPRPAWEPADSLAAAITDSLVPGGTRASWHAAGRDVRAAETPQRAALVLPVGQELFVWSATGPGAGRLLRRVVGTLAVRQ